MAITNGRNLAELASLINSDGKISAEAFSAELAASIDPTLYDSASDVPFEDAVKGTQIFVPSEGLLIKLTDSDWYSIDGSTGAAAAASWAFQGTVSGYSSGGRDPSISPTSINTVDKFSFSSDGNAADVGDLTQGRYAPGGQSSNVSGYSSGGNSTGNSNVIDKFPFAADANATDVGDLTVARYINAGQSSNVSGYNSAGYSTENSNVIDKFPFATDGNATDVGDLTLGRNAPAGQSSTEFGYASGGNTPGPYSNVIDKFSFATDGNATDVGDLTIARTGPDGQSSTTSGYTSGGLMPSAMVNTIDKFPFAADGNATDVGDLTTQVRFSAGGQSSTTDGYTTGGYLQPPATTRATIDKFTFASDANAVGVGSLTQSRDLGAGQQV